MTALSLLNHRLSAPFYVNGARSFDALVDDFFRPAPSTAFWHSATPAKVPTAARAILIDVTETDTAYQVSAELPGFKKEEISVKIDGADVSIEAVRSKPSADTAASEAAPSTPAASASPATLRAERFTGKLARSFRLEHELDDGKAEASFADGVLTLVLPKKAQPGAKSLTIQ